LSFFVIYFNKKKILPIKIGHFTLLGPLDFVRLDTVPVVEKGLWEEEDAFWARPISYFSQYLSFYLLFRQHSITASHSST
jgi:hypothetical protein